MFKGRFLKRVGRISQVLCLGTILWTENFTGIVSEGNTFWSVRQEFCKGHVKGKFCVVSRVRLWHVPWLWKILRSVYSGYFKSSLSGGIFWREDSTSNTSGGRFLKCERGGFHNYHIGEIFWSYYMRISKVPCLREILWSDYRENFTVTMCEKRNSLKRTHGEFHRYHV